MEIPGKFLKSIVRDAGGPEHLAFIGNNLLPKPSKLDVTFLESECGGRNFHLLHQGINREFKSLWKSYSLRSKDLPIVTVPQTPFHQLSSVHPIRHTAL